MHECRLFAPAFAESEKECEPLDRAVDLGRVASNTDKLPQPPAHGLGRVVLIDAREVADDGRDGRERGGVRKRARFTSEDRDRRAHAGSELFGQARLADARLAHDGDQDGLARGRGKAEALAQDRLLARAADEGDRSAGGPRGEALDRIRLQRSVEALRLHRSPPAVGDLGRREGMGRRSGEDLARDGGRLKPGRHVDHLPGHQKLPSWSKPCCRFTRLYADPNLQGLGEPG